MEGVGAHSDISESQFWSIVGKIVGKARIGIIIGPGGRPQRHLLERNTCFGERKYFEHSRPRFLCFIC
jgi:hypothetical protein